LWVFILPFITLHFIYPFGTLYTILSDAYCWVYFLTIWISCFIWCIGFYSFSYNICFTYLYLHSSLHSIPRCLYYLVKGFLNVLFHSSFPLAYYWWRESFVPGFPRLLEWLLVYLQVHLIPIEKIPTFQWSLVPVLPIRLTVHSSQWSFSRWFHLLPFHFNWLFSWLKGKGTKWTLYAVFSSPSKRWP